MTRILLIDDDAALTSLLRDYLENDGFSVRVENAAARGIEAALSGEVSVAVVDVMMPQLKRFRSAAQDPRRRASCPSSCDGAWR